MSGIHHFVSGVTGSIGCDITVSEVTRQGETGPHLNLIQLAGSSASTKNNAGYFTALHQPPNNYDPIHSEIHGTSFVREIAPISTILQWLSPITSQLGLPLLKENETISSSHPVRNPHLRRIKPYATKTQWTQLFSLLRSQLQDPRQELMLCQM